MSNYSLPDDFSAGGATVGEIPCNSNSDRLPAQGHFELVYHRTSSYPLTHFELPTNSLRVTH